MTKISISLPGDLAKALKRRAGPHGLSAYAARAIRHEIERERLGDYLAELERDAGALPAALLDEARAAWRAS